MKKYIILACVLLAVALCLVRPIQLALAAGTANVTVEWVPGQNTKITHINWTADAVNASVPATTVPPINGYFVRAISIPGYSAPTADYDMYVYEAAVPGFDLMGGGMVDRNSTDVEHTYPTNFGQIYSYGPLSFSLGGNAQLEAQGELRIYSITP